MVNPGRVFGGIALALLVMLTPSPALAFDAVEFRPPTTAPVLDPFRLPAGPYGPGNRGLEYDTRRGDPIRAAGSGVVAFAGPVAGSWFVSVDHPAGLRVTYGFVGRIVVAIGARVEPGDLVALADGPFHFTVRLDGVYLDPARLFGVHRRRVTLVPHRRGGVASSRFAAGRADRGATLLGGPSGPLGARSVPAEHVSFVHHPVASASRTNVRTGKKERSWPSSP